MNTTLKLFCALMMSFMLVACGGGGGGGGGGAPADPGSQSGGSTGGGGGDDNSTSNPNPPDDGSTTPVPPKSVSLSWTAPTARENGEPLSLADIKGYEIYYYVDGSSPGSGETIWVAGGSTTTHTVTLDSAGTYFFALAAVDQNDLRSETSNYVSVTVGP